MADPLSSHPRTSDAPGPSGEDARIEHLLVLGLDHYFAGEFDTAINLWTRVLFLDRAHDRARAYIERARSAQAEQQRQTEALVHQGIDAFDRGQVEQARTLLSTAIAQGASRDLALGVLGRIDRLDVPGVQPEPGRSRRPARISPGPAPAVLEAGGRRRWPGLAGAAIIMLILGVAGWAAWTWQFGPARPPATASVSPPLAAPPPVAQNLPRPGAAEVYVTRGRHLFETGRLRDALIELERVPIGSAQRAEAERLRAAIQRELLALALVDTAAGAPPRAAAGTGLRPE